jgi:acetyltransferase-like isoleucine patch superfamily enzyme
LRNALRRIWPDSSSPRDLRLELIGGGKPLVSIASFSYINSAILYCWKDSPSLVICEYCSIAEDVSIILGGDHDLDWVSTYPFIERWGLTSLKTKATREVRGDIIIGSDVWIGHGVAVLSGTTIGVGEVIGAGVVVRGHIPPYSIAAGVLSKFLKRRFDDEICMALEESQWWLLPKEAIKELVAYMDNPFECQSRLQQSAINETSHYYNDNKSQCWR